MRISIEKALCVNLKVWTNLPTTRSVCVIQLTKLHLKFKISGWSISSLEEIFFRHCAAEMDQLSWHRKCEFNIQLPSYWNSAIWTPHPGKDDIWGLQRKYTSIWFWWSKSSHRSCSTISLVRSTVYIESFVSIVCIECIARKILQNSAKSESILLWTRKLNKPIDQKFVSSSKQEEHCKSIKLKRKLGMFKENV